MARLSLNRRWTPEEEALLAQLLEEGKTWGQISVRLRRSTAAIQHHVRARRAFRQLGTAATAIDTGDLIYNGPKVARASLDAEGNCSAGKASP